MPLIGAAIAPHGPMIIPTSSNEEIAIHHEGLKKIKKTIQELQADIVFLSTPHGFGLQNDYGIYLNDSVSGSAEFNGEYSEYAISMTLAKDHSIELVSFLKSKNLPVSGVTAYAPSLAMPIAWGEVVPLWFLKDLKLDLIILSQPTRRHDYSPDMVSELHILGRCLFEHFESMSEKIFVLISGDLAHTHDPDAVYGFSETAEPFDKAIVEWSVSLNKDKLANDAGDLASKALSCGFTGFVMLQGLLENCSCTKEVLAYSHPTYFGMVTSIYQIQK